jgi:hypothetical protein
VSVRKEIESDVTRTGWPDSGEVTDVATANRAKYCRDRQRYPSDLIDAGWPHIAPLVPPAKRGGRKRSVDVREVVNGIMYVLSTGCQLRYVPKALAAA